MSDPTGITISVPIDLIEPLINALIREARLTPDPRIDELVTLTQRLLTMSSTISQQVDDAATRDEAAMAKLSTDLAAIATELKAGAPPVGSTITQAQADRHTAIATSIEAAAAAAGALVTTPVVTPPAPVVFNATDPTPNSAGGRNSSHLANFDTTKPETP